MPADDPSSASRPVAIGLRLYRALARAFPYEFRNLYGDDLDQVTEESIEPVWRRHGAPGLVRMLADLAVRVPAEHFAELRKDVRYSLRMLAAARGFTFVALLSLGLAIAVAATAYSEMNAAVLRDLPGVPQPDRLAATQMPVSFPTFERFRSRTDLFSSAFAYMAPVPFGVTIAGRSHRTWGHIASPGYFSTLGIRPAMGQFSDDPGAIAVSYRFWKEHLNSDPGIVGKPLRVNGRPFTVAAVAPETFLGAAPMIFYADLWLPTTAGSTAAPELADHALDRRDRKIFLAVGRLQPGVSAARAEAELDTVARQLELSYGEEDREIKGRRITLVPGGKAMPVRPQDLQLVTVLPFVLVSLVLLIACSNVGNMMLARAASRRREIAVRLAIGAGRTSIIRQLLTESMLLALGAGVFGFLLAVWFLRMCSQVAFPFPMPVTYDFTPDLRVIGFTFLLTLLTGVAFGLIPALQASRTDLTTALKEGADVRIERHRRLSLRNILVTAQVAGSLSLLLVTGFLVVGFQRNNRMDAGFDPRNIYSIALDPVRDGYTQAQTAAFFDKLLDRVKRLPGISSACLTDTPPMRMSGQGLIPVSSAGDARTLISAAQYVVSRDYFDVLGVPILSGRGLRKEDEAGGTNAAIVSESVARLLWSGDAIGRRIEIGDYAGGARFNRLSGMGSFDRRAPAPGAGKQVREVVGVVKDMRWGMGLEKPGPGIYFPMRAADYSQPSLNGVSLLVRGEPGAGDILAAVRREVGAMDEKIMPFHAQTMEQQIDEIFSLFRLAAWIYGAVGMFGLILASTGLAGITAYSVTQRTHEIGIRMALGARRADVLRLVMKEGMALVIVGAAIGLAMAQGATRVLSVFLSAISQTVTHTNSDPVLLIGAPLLLGLLALVACYVPARRSTRIDPVVALRQE